MIEINLISRSLDRALFNGALRYILIDRAIVQRNRLVIGPQTISVSQKTRQIRVPNSVPPVGQGMRAATSFEQICETFHSRSRRIQARP